MIKATLASATLLVLSTTVLSAQQVTSGAVRLRLSGRVQAQFNTTSVDEDELRAFGLNPAPVPTTTFEIRRARLGAEVEYSDLISGKAELDFAMGRIQMRDVYVNFDFDEKLRLRVGQMKRPFSLLSLTSSTRYPVIERGVRIRGLPDALRLQDTANVLGRFGSRLIGEEQFLLDAFEYTNFDIGAMLHGEAGPFGYSLGVFNGTGSDSLANTGTNSVAGRVTVQPWKQRPLVFGGAVSTREVRLADSLEIETRYGAAWEADLEYGEFRRPGFHVLAELSGGRNLATDDDSFLAAQGIVAYFRPVEHKTFEGWELAGRASYGDARTDIDADAGLLLTPGFNIYFTGRNRLMFNWDVFIPQGNNFETQSAFRAQAQVVF